MPSIWQTDDKRWEAICNLCSEGHFETLGVRPLRGRLLSETDVLIGLLSSLAVARLLASQLFGVTPNDPVTLVGVAAVIATASLIACYLPARRATAIDPMEALRHE